MREPLAALLDARETRDFCARIAPNPPLRVSHLPLVEQPPLECFTIVPEYIAAHGGEQLNGWAIWEVPGVFIEAEFHAISRDPAGELRDLTPRLNYPVSITFLPDPDRVYRGRQVDNIREPLVDDADIIRFALGNRHDLPPWAL